MSNKIFTVFFVFISLTALRAATCKSTGSGNWNSASTWSCGSVPTCGDSVIILATHAVSVTSNNNYSGCSSKMAIVIRGILYFTGGSKMRLPCNSNIYIYSGGSLQSDGSGNSNQLDICGTTYWSGSQGTASGPGCFPPSGPACGVVLPIELVNFTGQQCISNICLRWETLSETDNDHFEVQRLEHDDFIAVGTVSTISTNGVSKMRLNYSFSEPQTYAGIYYYRLKQINKDHSYKIYNTIAVNYQLGPAFELAVVPNPNEGTFVLRWQCNNDPNARIVIKNPAGETLVSQNTNGACEMAFNTNGSLFPGMYICSLVTSGSTVNFKLVIN